MPTDIKLDQQGGNWLIVEGSVLKPPLLTSCSIHRRDAAAAPALIDEPWFTILRTD